MPAECSIGLKAFPDGILSDREENPIKAIMGDHVTSKLEVQDVSFQTQILSVTLKAVAVKSGDTGGAFVRYPNSSSCKLRNHNRPFQKLFSMRLSLSECHPRPNPTEDVGLAIPVS